MRRVVGVAAHNVRMSRNRMLRILLAGTLSLGAAARRWTGAPSGWTKPA